MNFIRFFLVLIVCLSLQSRYHKITRINDLDKIVNNYEYSLVCFAPTKNLPDESIDKEEIKERKKEFRGIEEILRSISKGYDYKNFLSKDIGLISVDVSEKYAYSAISEYGLVQMPSCFVFEQGENTGQKVMYPDSSRDLTRLLERVGGTDFKKLLADRKSQATQERQERIARYYAYGAYPYSYNWGYGYGGPYWYRPYWGWYGACW